MEQNKAGLDQHVSSEAPGAWSDALAVKPQVKGHSPISFSLAPSGPDLTSFWSPHLPSVPDSRNPGISVTSGVFVIFEISWDRICLISLSGTHTGEVESYGNTQAYPLLQVNSTSGPFHALVRRSFHLTRGRVVAPSGIQCLIIAVWPCVSKFKWLITNKAWCRTWCGEEYLNSPCLNLAIWFFNQCALSTMAWPWGLWGITVECTIENCWQNLLKAAEV